MRYKLILTYTPDDRSNRQTKTEYTLELPDNLDKYAIVKAAMENISHQDLYEENEYEIREQLHDQAYSDYEYSFYSLDGENHYEITPVNNAPIIPSTGRIVSSSRTNNH